MKTDDLIKALASDLPVRPLSVQAALARALLIAVPVACLVLIYALKVRPDIGSALHSARFLFKFVFTLSLFGAAIWLTMRLSRPGVAAGPALLALGGSLAMLATAFALELLAVPSGAWMSTLVGNMAFDCVVQIPLLSIAPLIAILFALKAGAPDNTTAAGAAAGLLAGAVGATFYAPHCPNDSPLFVAVWYLIGIAAVTVVGSLVGRRFLRW